VIIYNARLNQDDGGYGYFPPIEDVARMLNMKAIKIPYRDAVDIVQGIYAFAAACLRGVLRRNTNRREAFTNRIHKGISRIQIRIETCM
jgi:hypothetical protein